MHDYAAGCGAARGFMISVKTMLGLLATVLAASVASEDGLSSRHHTPHASFRGSGGWSALAGLPPLPKP